MYWTTNSAVINPNSYVDLKYNIRVKLEAVPLVTSDTRQLKIYEVPRESVPYKQKNTERIPGVFC